MEEWRDIPGYNGDYQASSLGKIRSVDRTIVHKKYGTQTRKGVVLSIGTNRNGYEFVIVKNRVIVVHRLVMAAFHGISELHVDHIDGVKTNNRIENLEYVTSRQNAHRYYIKSKKSSKHIGVCYHKTSGKWVANIQINRVNKYLGLFSTEELAMVAYQKSLNTSF